MRSGPAYRTAEVKALDIMDREAEAAGETPLSVDIWECAMSDGRVLVIVKTTAEASRIAAAANLGADGYYRGSRDGRPTPAEWPRIGHLDRCTWF